MGRPRRLVILSGAAGAAAAVGAALMACATPPRRLPRRMTWNEPVGAENSSTSGDLDVFVDQPTETIDP
jgi:hypothetical protein